MSIAALADEEILRTDRRNLDVRQIIAPRLNSVVAKFGLDAKATTELNAALEPVASDSPIKKTAASSAIDGLAKYIPTESITLYVAATAAWSSLHKTFPSLTLLQLYWGFVVLTPVLFLLVYLGKRRSQGLPLLPESPWQWPWWKLIASTIAFMVWALAIPPLVDIDGNVVAGFGALIVSTLLSLVGAVVEPPEKTDGK